MEDTMITAEEVTPILRGVLLGALATVLLLAAPAPGSGQGAGTSYFACRDQSWADYNECLMNDPYSWTNSVKCFIAWDLDNVSCDIKLLKDLF
jgi:hypothetical protein